MKNTKLTQNLDNSKEQQDIQSPNKRKILASIGVTSGVIGASALSQQWTKPIVNSIVLPAHAVGTDMMATTMAPTMAPTDPPAPMPMINLSTFPASQLMGDSLGVLMAGDVRTVRVSLNAMPDELVTVSVSGDGVTAVDLMFDDRDYDKEQDVMITAATAPADMESEEESMVTLTAKGGNYDEMKRELTYTVGYYGADPVSNVKVMVSDSVAPNGMAKVTWDEPDTRKERKQYRVTVTGAGTGADAPKVTIDGEEADITEMKAGTAMVTVEVIYADDMAIPDPDAPVAADKPVV